MTQGKKINIRMDKEFTQVVLDKQLNAFIKKQAALNGQTVSGYIRMALTQHYWQHKNENSFKLGV